jgi:hypothetical protein
MTRARDHLAVTYPFNVYDSRRSADYTIDQVSRFLDRGVRDLMQKVVVDQPQAPVDDAPAVQPSTLDLRAILQQRFSGS